MKASKQVEDQVRWIRSCESTLNRLCIGALLVHTFGPNTRGLARPGLPYKQDACTHVSNSPYPPLHAHICARTVLRAVQVSQSCNATYKHDTGIFLSLGDAGKTEDVGGLHEQAADDGRPQRPLRGPNACPRESRRRRCQGCHRRTGKMFSPTTSDISLTLYQ